MTADGQDRKPLRLTEIAADDIRSQLGELWGRVGFGGERILITRHGKPIAGIVSVADVKRLQDEAA